LKDLWRIEAFFSLFINFSNVNQSLGASIARLGECNGNLAFLLLIEKLNDKVGASAGGEYSQPQ
jgi:hypothetical protein